jgi:hypothetical protein
MKNRLKKHTLTRTITHLFTTKKVKNAHKLYPDKYYRNIYFTKQLYDGIELVGVIERINKKQAADLLMRAGLSSYMGGKVDEYIKMETEARECNQTVQVNRFVRLVRRYAREHGMDISKIT